MPDAPVADAPVVAAPAAPVAPVTPADPPAFVMPDKFKGKSAEEIARAYTELEKVKGAAKPTAAPVVDPNGTGLGLADPGAAPAVPDVNDEAGLDAFVAGMGLKVEDLSTALQTDGKLTEEQYKAFRAKGFGKKAVDEYLGLVVEKVALTTKLSEYQQKEVQSEAHSMFGGKEQWDALMSYGATQDDHAAIHARLQDPAQWRGAAAELHLRQQKAAGASGSATPHQGQAAQPAGGFTGPNGHIEMHAAMKALRAKGIDPFTDPAFRARLDLTPNDVKRRA